MATKHSTEIDMLIISLKTDFIFNLIFNEHFLILHYYAFVLLLNKYYFTCKNHALDLLNLKMFCQQERKKSAKTKIKLLSPHSITTFYTETTHTFFNRKNLNRKSCYSKSFHSENCM